MSLDVEIDYAVFIGRFSPLHNGHLTVMKTAFSKAKKVIVLLGSDRRPRTAKNPFSAAERATMVHAACEEVLHVSPERLITRGIGDHLYAENRWIAEVQKVVADAIREDGGDPKTAKVALVGRNKDSSSYYLNSFAQWGVIEVPRCDSLSATEIRRHLFSGSTGDWRLACANVPHPVTDMLKAFQNNSSAYAGLKAEHDYVEKYKSSWKGSPFPPMFVTVDAVVLNRGHVLLVRRKGYPGKGLWALPGGFLNQRETLKAAMLRELKEETRIKVSKEDLENAIRRVEVFDHPDRSQIGRLVTHAHLLDLDRCALPGARRLVDNPEVMGDDDAEIACWIPIAEALEMSEDFFDDHFDILEMFMGSYRQ